MNGHPITRFVDGWMHFWFEPATASNLGMCRLLFFALLFLMYLPEDFSAWGSVSHAFWMPLWMFKYTGLLPLGTTALEVLEVCWRIALISSAIGLFSRLSMAVAFAAGAYLFALPHNFGQTYHFDALLVFVMGVLAVSRAGAAWSIDSLIAAYRNRSGARPQDSGEFNWPLRLIWVAMAFVFFGAGFSKLRHAGIEWAMSDTMQTFLIRAHYGVSDADPLVSWGLTLSEWPWAPRVLAATSLAVEVLFPLALISRTARWVFVPASFGMLVGIRALMGPTFGGFLIAYAFWPSWTAVGHRLRAWFPSRRDVMVRFDGECSACAATVAVMQRLDVSGRLKVLDVTRDRSTVTPQRDGLDRVVCVDENALTGSGYALRGLVGLMRITRRGGLVGPCLQSSTSPADAVNASALPYEAASTHRRQ